MRMQFLAVGSMLVSVSILFSAMSAKAQAPARPAADVPPALGSPRDDETASPSDQPVPAPSLPPTTSQTPSPSAANSLIPGGSGPWNACPNLAPASGNCCRVNCCQKVRRCHRGGRGRCR